MSDLEYCRRPCLAVAHAIKWLPVGFISVVVVWSYYAYVVQFNVLIVESIPEKVLYLFTFHVIFGLFVWSYARTIFTDPGSVPSSWRLSPTMTERLKSAKSEEDWKTLLELFAVQMQIPVVQVSVQSAIRYCEKCQMVKPDRSHHCSICEQCIRKMDHHCPWVNNCVAFGNYKFFLLFLGYALVYCILIAATALKYFLKFFDGGFDGRGSEKFHLLFVFLVAILFSISVSSLFWYHIYLVFQNRTTLEQFRAPYFRNGGQDERGWSLGFRNNFQEVFGQNPLLWFIPVFTSMGDGLVYPTRSAPPPPPQSHPCRPQPDDLESGYQQRSISKMSDNLTTCDNTEKIATEVVLDQDSLHLVRVVANPTSRTSSNHIH